MNTANPCTTGTEQPTDVQPSLAAAAPKAERAAPPASAQPGLSPRVAIGLIGMLLASLSAIVNQQVTGQAMTDIRGALSIGIDDGTWLTVLFEAANVAAMVFAPWFGVTFTLKRFTIGAMLATMFFGLLCPLAPNLPALYALRALQGISGGCLPPMLIIVALRYLPPKIKLYGLAGYALTATFGPALGTPLTALWTEYVSWRMAFWQIVPLGLVSCVAMQLGLPQDPVKLERFRSFNWSGFITGFPAVAMLVIGLLQGDRLDWLNSGFICLMLYGGALLLVAFLINEWCHPLPFFRLQLLSRRNFLHGLLTLVGAVVLLTGVAVIPAQYLAEVHGYRPLQTTPLALLVAIPLLIALPMTAAALNIRRVDFRWILAIGLALMATTCFMGSFVTSDWVRENFYWLQSLQIAAQPMLIMCILMGVTTGLPPTEGPFASAMFNSFKAFSAAVATGLIEGLGTAREHFHSSMLVDRLGNTMLVTSQSVDATHGLGELAHRIHTQAVVLTSADLYRVMTGIALVLLVLVRCYPCVSIRHGALRSLLPAEQRYRSPIMKIPQKIIGVAVCLIVLGIAASGRTALLPDSTTESTNDAYVTADFTLVAPRVAGQLAEVLVEDNQRVKAGQLLVRIDDRDFRAALMSAEADVAAAKASVANDDAEIARQPSLVDQARATLRADDASIGFARENAARYQNLSATGAGTTQEQQHAASTLAEQLARQAHDQAALLATEQNLDVLRTQRDKAAGALAHAEAVREQAKLSLSYTGIRAPIDGKVGRRSARVGAFVTTGAPLLAIVPLSDAYIVANFQENQLTRMRPGEDVRITVDSMPGVVIRGHVDSLAPATGMSFALIAPDNATGNFTKIVQRVPVKITIDRGQEAAAELSVGLSVETEVAVAGHRDAPVEPAGKP
jgi:MFS transporter, DHA2 family, multidrug resistance protein